MSEDLTGGTPATADVEAQLAEAIGQRVRAFRRQLGFTITQTASYTGISKGMMSKIENAQASPSLSTLARIAAALDVPLTSFFDDLQTRTVIHIRNGRGLDLIPRGSRSGVRAQLLGSLGASDHRRMEPVLYTLTRRSRISESFRHPGTEFLYVINGTVEYGYGAQRFVLETGDSLQFDAEVTHGPVRLIEIPVTLLQVKAYGIGNAGADH